MAPEGHEPSHATPADRSGHAGTLWSKKGVGSSSEKELENEQVGDVGGRGFNITGLISEAVASEPLRTPRPSLSSATQLR